VWTSEYAFDQFYDAINLTGDYRVTANARRDWVLQRLRANGLTVLEAIPIGSIPRYTALRDHADVDVMAVLHFGNHIKNRRPSQVLETVRNALSSGSAGTLRRDGQAVTVSFASWPNVDVVPTSRLAHNGVVTGYQIPDMHREEWIDTNPPAHGRDITAAAAARGKNFRRVLKMVKHWNRRQTIQLQSYHIEVIALNLETDWSDYGWPLLQWFKAAQPACDFLWHANSDVSGYLSWERAQRAKTQLSTAEALALTGWYATTRNDDRGAIGAFKSVFGQNFPAYG
jgi:hypothetical protein